MPIRVTDTNGWGYDSAIANCITWAADKGARGANVSFGGVCGSPIVQAAAKYMRDRGGVVTASAGNTGGVDNSAPNDNMTCVGATNSGDARTSWSTYGSFVDVVAPGENIFTTVNGSSYGGVSGTSFSAPVTLGVYALMMAANPALTPTQLDNVLFSTAKDLGAAGKDTYYGYGRIDAAAAVAKAGGASTADTTAPTVTITNLTAGLKVTGTVGVDVSANDAGGVSRVELYVNGKLLTTDTISPYGFSWDTSTMADGTVNLVAKAYDAAGNVGTSSQVAVTVGNDTTPPVAQIVSPSAGTTVTGTVTISGSATDNQKVAKMTLQVDGREVAVTYGSSLSYAWSTGTTSRKGKGRKTEVQSSSTITVIAEDAAGNKGMASQTVIRQ
jgi:thermitase